MKKIKKLIFLVVLFIILFSMFVYFGGGTAVKFLGNEVVIAGEYMEDLEVQMKKYIQDKINRLQKAKKGLLSSEPGR